MTALCEPLEARQLLAADPRYLVLAATLPTTEHDDIGRVLVVAGAEFVETTKYQAYRDLYWSPPGSPETVKLFGQSDGAYLAQLTAFGDAAYISQSQEDGSIALVRLDAGDGSISNVAILPSHISDSWSDDEALYLVCGSTLLRYDGQSLTTLSEDYRNDATQTALYGDWTFSTNGAILWQSRGPEGERQNVGSQSEISQPVRQFIVAGDTLFLLYGDSPFSGGTLYSAPLDPENGIVGEPQPVDYSNGIQAYVSGKLAVVDNRVVFNWFDSASYRDRLSVAGSDGAETLLVSSASGSLSDNFGTLVSLGVNASKAVFYRNAKSDALRGYWVTDGTANGTVRYLEDPAETVPTLVSSNVGDFAFGIIRFDGFNSVFRTDGTAEGTTTLTTPAFADSSATILQSPDSDDLYTYGGSDVYRFDAMAPGTTVYGSAVVDANRNGQVEGFEGRASGRLSFDGLTTWSNDRPIELPFREHPEAGYEFPNFVPGQYTLSFRDFNDQPSDVPSSGTYVLDIDGSVDELRRDFFVYGDGGVLWGRTFDDLNENGVWDDGDVATRTTMYLDENFNGAYDRGELQTSTAADGTFGFTGLAAGTYAVRHRLDPTLQQITPVGYDGYTIELDENEVHTASLDFALKPATPSIITASLWLDWNGSGDVDGADELLVPVPNESYGYPYLDENANGKRDGEELLGTWNPTTQVWEWTVPPGTWHVSHDAPSGAHVSTPLGQPALQVSVGEGDNVYAGQLLLSALPGEPDHNGVLTGTVDVDRDGDGQLGSNDLPAAGLEIFIDRNDDGAFSVSDPRTRTDADGRYTFRHLPAHTAHVYAKLPDGWTRITPEAFVSANVADNAVNFAPPMLVASTDRIAPTVLNGIYDADGRTLRLSFSEDVVATLTPQSLELFNVTAGTSVAWTDFDIDVAADRTMVGLDLSSLNLPDGRYDLRSTDAIRDAAGNSLDTEVLARFDILAADATGDGKVDGLDFLRLRAHLGTTSGGLFSNGDFNYDGRIDGLDFLILRGRLGRSLPPRTAPLIAEMFATAPFADTPVRVGRRLATRQLRGR